MKTFCESLEFYSTNFPNNICIACGNKEYTYYEVEQISEKLAHLLFKKGIKKGESIGVYGTRSELIPIFMISILKVGAIFVPLNNSFPKERIKLICQDANIRLILADYSADNLDLYPMSIDILKFDINNIININHNCNVPISISVHYDLEDPMAIFYTSGSSGIPKGVIHTHKSILTSNKYDVLFFKFSEIDRLLLVTHWSICFSITIYAGISVGASIFIAPNDVCNDLFLLDRYVNDKHITILHVPTQIGYQYCAIASSQTLRLLLMGGSVFPGTSHELSFEIFNIYGSTEGMALSYINCKNHKGTASLGYPCKHCEWIVVDENYKKVDSGTKGELLIAGDSLSIGYLNSPSLNNARYFVYEGKRVFNTKDIVRKEADGSYSIFGRSDMMIKLRGQRIEIPEIETTITKFPTVNQACVKLITNTNQEYLCAYITTSAIKLDIRGLKDFLSVLLPDYMIPEHYVVINSIPLTERGKIDYDSLPSPNNMVTKIKKANTENEKILLRCLNKVLKSDDFGIDNTLSEIGCDSLNSLILYYELRKEGYYINSNRNIRNKTIQSLAKDLKCTNRSESKINTNWKICELNSLCRLLIEHNDIIDVNRFLIVDYLQCVEKNNIALLTEVVKELISQHAILNTYICGKSTLRKRPDIDLKSIISEYYSEGNTHDVSNVIKDFLGSFDIRKRMFKVLLLHRNNEDLIIIATHHLISDGISKRVLLRDFCTLYSQIRNRQAINLYKNNIDYGTFNHLIRNYYDKFLGKAFEFQLQEKQEFYYRPSNRTIHKYVKYKFDVVRSAQIIKDSVNCKYGLLTSFLKAYSSVVCSMYQSESMLIQVIRSGRINKLGSDENYLINLDSTLGCFAVSHPLRFNANSCISEIDSIIDEVPESGVEFDSLGGYKNKIFPKFGIDIVGNNDILSDSHIYGEYFCKAKVPERIEGISDCLDMGCAYLLFVIISNGSVILQARYNSSLFSDSLAKKILYELTDYI